MILARNEGRDIVAEGPEILDDGGEVLHAAAPGARHLEGRDLQLRLDRHAGLRPDRHRGRVT